MTTDDLDDIDAHRLDLRSDDVVVPRIEALASLFPEAVRDGKVDVDALAQALGDVRDDGPERFGLTWPGKAEAIRLAQRPSEGTLVPSREQSVGWDDTRNLLIEGENLEVLKLLQRSYHGTAKLLRDVVAPMGVEVAFTDLTSEAAVRDALAKPARELARVGAHAVLGLRKSGEA